MVTGVPPPVARRMERCALSGFTRWSEKPCLLATAIDWCFHIAPPCTTKGCRTPYGPTGSQRRPLRVKVALIEKRLAAVTGKRVAMTMKIDKEIIGGVVARVGSTVYDASVATQLKKIRERLTT